MQDAKSMRITIPHQDALAVASTVSEFVEQHGGRVLESRGDDQRARFGSRAALRWMGVFTTYGRERLPYILTTRSTAEGLEVSLASDEGWYLFELRVLGEAYEALFTDVLAELQDALGAASSPA